LETSQTKEAATLLSSIADAKRCIGDFDGARKAFQDSLEIFKATKTLESPLGAVFLQSLGTLLLDTCDVDGAEVHLHHAHRIREATGTLENPMGALLLFQLGRVHAQKVDLEQAIKSYKRSLSIRRETRTLTTVHGVELLAHLGDLELRMGNAQGGLEAHKEAIKAMEDYLGSRRRASLHPSATESLGISRSECVRSLGDLERRVVSLQASSPAWSNVLVCLRQHDCEGCGLVPRIRIVWALARLVLEGPIIEAMLDMFRSGDNIRYHELLAFIFSD